MKPPDAYLDTYARHTDERVLRDPQRAVGGNWELLGRLQLEFLLQQGLRAEQRLLDIGCGTLRGGRHFIRFLQPRCYVGFDISANAVAYARQLVSDEGLQEKEPRILINAQQNLRFAEFAGEQFDVVFAHSVFTHLKPEHIEECFLHVGRIMTENGRFFFTYNVADAFVQTGPKAFRYPAVFFESLSEETGFALSDVSGSYKHPRGQRMMMVSKG